MEISIGNLVLITVSHDCVDNLFWDVSISQSGFHSPVLSYRNGLRTIPDSGDSVERVPGAVGVLVAFEVSAEVLGKQ